MRRFATLEFRASSAFFAVVLAAATARADVYSERIAPLFKTHCVKCHGPAKAEGGLNLSRATGVRKGGKSGAAVAPHDLAASLLWDRVEADEMPPKSPLGREQKAEIRKWIESGAGGLAGAAASSDEHWSFRRLAPPVAPHKTNQNQVINHIDAYVEADLRSRTIAPAPDAGRARLIRRVFLTVTGLPPSSELVEAFVADDRPDAYARMVDRALADPGYGARWGKFWLDAAGYADSNGYFNADSDRPLAYRYRDYVVRSLNADKPFDVFIQEQLAGDELGDFQEGEPTPEATIDRVVATHFLRNGQDGSGESDGNPDEVRVDRYTALETCQQIVASSLLGLTMQCAKCHAHKFEPISQEDYYRFQAIFDPVFPAATTSLWIKPQARLVSVPTFTEVKERRDRLAALETDVARLRREVEATKPEHRPRGVARFADDFDSGRPLSESWSAVAPGDDAPGGKPPVMVDGDAAPSARIRGGRLEINAGVTLDSWLVTQRSFDWTPDVEGESIQATFDLVALRIGPEEPPAERVGYFIAAVDFDDGGKTPGGNILVDGHPNGPSSVYLDYPGADMEPKKAIGKTGYRAGSNYGVRVTNAGKGKFKLEHVVDGVAEENALMLARSDLPDGAFGFEYHANRRFIVDNLRVESFPPPPHSAGVALREFEARVAKSTKALARVEQELKTLRSSKPGLAAWASDVTAKPPPTHLLIRGDYAEPGAAVEPGPPSALVDGDAPFVVKPPASGRSTGRRLAFARWLTDPRGRGAALTARVQVNRVWQAIFGSGLAATPENLGLSGVEPTHPELLDALAHEYMNDGWSQKRLIRRILNSAAFRRSSDGPGDAGRFARFPTVRLDAEAIRDAMLFVSGDLDHRRGGPPIRLDSGDGGAVVVDESVDGAKRRSIDLTSKRTRVVSLLQVFDTPSIVFNALRRPRTTMPLQTLALLNSEFVRTRARSFAVSLAREAPEASARVDRAFRRAFGRPPSVEEKQEALRSLAALAKGYGDQGETAAWVDFCQSLLISNEFLYLD